MKNIVLLHGWGSSTKKLTNLKNKLQNLGWSVFLTKLPGFEIKAPQNTWGINEYASYIQEKSHNFFKDKKYFVFGHSFGGRICLRMASQGLQGVEGVIICSSAGLSRPPLIKRAFFFILAKIGKIILFSGFLAGFWRKFVYKLAHEHDYEQTEGVMKKVFKKVIRENQKAEILKITIPSLILWGDNDQVTPKRDAFYLASKIKHSKLIIYKDIGHKLPYERYEEIALDIDKWVKTLK